MKTTSFTITETRVYSLIKATYKGRTIVLPYKDRWKLHPGYIEPTYLNSLDTLRGLINSKYDELVLRKPNPYPSYGSTPSAIWMHYTLLGEYIAPYKDWLINLLKEIRESGGYLNYNHPRRVVAVLSYSLYECHSVFDHHTDCSPISLKEIYTLQEEYGLRRKSDYPEDMYPELK